MAKKTEQREQTTVMLGWAAKPLHEQLQVPRKDLEVLQADANAILGAVSICAKIQEIG